MCGLRVKSLVIENYSLMVTVLEKSIYRGVSKTFFMDGYLGSPLFSLARPTGLVRYSRGEVV